MRRLLSAAVFLAISGAQPGIGDVAAQVSSDLLPVAGPNGQYALSDRGFNVPVLPEASVLGGGAPSVESFEVEAVDLPTGEVSFSVPLGSVKSISGNAYAVALAYSSTGVREAAKTWNLYAPAGEVGLGWTLPEYFVALDPRGTGTRHDDAFYVVLGGERFQAFKTGWVAQGEPHYTFGLSPHREWNAAYFPDDERWELTMDDGTVYVFGGNGTGTLHQNVRWGNWIGTSVQPLGQEHYVSRWNLGAMRSAASSEQVVFEYEQDLGRVGNGLHYTEASYLKRVAGTDGGSLVLHYEQKHRRGYFGRTLRSDDDPSDQWREYQRRWALDGGAHQEPVRARYLDRLDVVDAEGGVERTITLAYSMSGSEDSVKRLLRAVEYASTSATHSPRLTFDYYGEGCTSDAPALDPLVLCSVTLPTGGVVRYTYGDAVPAHGSRELVVSAPAGFKNPRVWIHDQYVVVTWWRPDSGNFFIENARVPAPGRLAVRAYTWEGRWVEWEAPTIEGIITKTFMQDFSVHLEDEFFGLVTNTRTQLDTRHWLSATYEVNSGPKRVYLYRRSQERVGSFDTYYDELALDGAFVQTGTGRQTLTVASTHDAYSATYAWSPSGWTKTETGVAGTSLVISRMHSFDDDKAVEVNAGADELCVRFTDEFGVLQRRCSPLPTALHNDYQEPSLDNRDPLSIGTVSSLGALAHFDWWGSDVAQPRTDVVFDKEYGVAAASVVDNSSWCGEGPVTAAVNAGYHLSAELYTRRGVSSDFPWGCSVYFDGRHFHTEGFHETALAFHGHSGSFRVKREFVGPGGLDYDDKLYDLDYESADWQLIDVPESQAGSGVVGADYYVADRDILYKTPRGWTNGATGWTDHGRWWRIGRVPHDVSPAGSYYRNKSEMRTTRWGLVYNAYSSDPAVPHGTQALLFRNATVHRSWFFPGELAYHTFPALQPVVGHLRLEHSDLVGEHTLVTFDYDEDAHALAFHEVEQLRLRRIVGHEASGLQRVRVVRSVEASDGEQSRVVSFGYEAATATMNYAGTSAAFNGVQVVRGSPDPAVTPHGYTQYYFYNGADTQGRTYPVGEYIGTDPHEHPQRLLGRVYAEETYDADGELVGETVRYHQVGTVPVDPFVAAPYVRTHRVERTSHR